MKRNVHLRGAGAGINRGIIEAHERGVVTSASLMVRGNAAADAASYCRRRPQLALGWHLDLGEWIFRDGQWVTLYAVAPMDDVIAVRQEVHRQLEVFLRLVGRPPTHIDSHQHVHRDEPVREILEETAQNIGVPLRFHSPSVRYCGSFYGQTSHGEPISGAISVTALIDILQNLPPGWTELGCHPGRGRDLNTIYSTEREQELETLCDPAIRQTIRACGIELRSWAWRSDAAPGSACERG